MAYVAGEVLVIVEGMTGATERWSNTWAFNSVDLADEEDVVSAVHGFYESLTINATLNDAWSTTNATLRRLASGVSENVAWEGLSGGNAGILAPTQLGVRVSINDVDGHNGGPFLCGWSVASIGEGGLLAASDQTDVAAALDEMNTAVVATGAFIGLHRPTIQSVPTATRGRVGQRFDVMRSRGNDTAEAYVTVTLT